jgi:hypothetical protein
MGHDNTAGPIEGFVQHVDYRFLLFSLHGSTPSNEAVWLDAIPPLVSSCRFFVGTQQNICRLRR